MMKMIIAAVAGLLLGVGGGTGFVMMRHEPAAALAEGEASDSTHVAGTEGAHGEGGHGGPGAENAHGETVASQGGEHGGSAATPAPAPLSHQPAADSHALPVAAGAPAPKISASAEADSTRARLSRIFAAMKPEDAAVVLEKLDDASVRLLLLNLSDRKAAAILSSMPGEKAAMVTRTMLADARGG
jgi:hypothetical protein